MHLRKVSQAENNFSPTEFRLPCQQFTCPTYLTEQELTLMSSAHRYDLHFLADVKGNVRNNKRDER